MDETKEMCDNFREVFKYFKRKKPPPDFSDVLDVRRLSEEKNFTRLKPFPVVTPDIERVPGLRSVNSWQAFTFPDHPGFLFILNPFLPSYDRVWAERCLRDYTQKPNHSNLDAHETQTAMDDIWRTCVSNPSQRASLLNKLRWVTLGYHHDWDTKVYSLDDYSPLPPNLCRLSQYVASAVGFPSYLPEAAIVNFYPLGSTLSGHTDHSELDHQSPIISFSFGCTAIFLLGGATKRTKPIPIYIRSGDVVAMFGVGRLNYHGVARIVPESWYSDLSRCHSPQLASSSLQLKYDSKAATLSTTCSSSTSADCVMTDSEITKNAEPYERGSDGASSVDSSDDFGSSGKEQLCCSAASGHRLKSGRGGGREGGGGGGGCLERDFCDGSSVIAELVTDYLKTARININVRQVFATSSSSTPPRSGDPNPPS